MRRFRLFDCSLLFVLTIVPTANAQRFTVTTFGDVGVGTTSQSITVTGTNTSGQPIVFRGAAGIRHFNLDAGTCHLKDGRDGLAPGDSCTFTVNFSPTGTGEDMGPIWLSTSAGLVDFHLSGTGTD